MIDILENRTNITILKIYTYFQDLRALHICIKYKQRISDEVFWLLICYQLICNECIRMTET